MFSWQMTSIACSCDFGQFIGGVRHQLYAVPRDKGRAEHCRRSLLFAAFVCVTRKSHSASHIESFRTMDGHSGSLAVTEFADKYWHQHRRLSSVVPSHDGGETHLKSSKLSPSGDAVVMTRALAAGPRIRAQQGRGLSPPRWR